MNKNENTIVLSIRIEKSVYDALIRISGTHFNIPVSTIAKHYIKQGLENEYKGVGR